jgi:NADPH:quinone reductase-like Zn-dependent oxidoreductase
MKAIQITEYGPPNVIRVADVPSPEPQRGQLRLRVRAAGVAPWDALIREGHSGIPQKLPLILGSDVSGTVEAVGPGVSGFAVDDEVYGLTNDSFIGGYAEYALASAKSMARKPKKLSFIEAASVPVVAVTAWQMLFEYAHTVPGQSVLILGAAGNVGAYAVQLARDAGLDIFATASSKDLDYVLQLAAGRVKVIDRQASLEQAVPPVDAVIDTVGGDTRIRSVNVLKPGGILVSVVTPPMPEEVAAKANVRSAFFFVDVNTARLDALSNLFDAGKLVPQVGTVLPLADAQRAHEMLAGAPHARGKIVLNVTP